MRIRQTTRKLKVLDFDIENRPLSYWYDGKPTAEITAIAWSWEGSNEVHAMLLGEEETEAHTMLQAFVNAYNLADMVTGHYIRNHDLPIINGALMENKMPPLPPKLTSDTKNDLIKRDGLSMSQEALSAMYRLPLPKTHMTQQDWRDANRLTPEGFEKTRERVVSDVRQHKLLRKTLLEYGALKAPRIWRP